VKVLLDSHALLWAVIDDPRLSRRAREVINDAATDVFVSTASYYELVFKARRGRLVSAALRVAEEVAGADFAEMDVAKAHLLTAAGLEWAHGDPWDRILAAQALMENCVFVSVDEVFDDIALERLW
jgi:PIN domain nuclease of toxin-antitoxin system